MDKNHNTSYALATAITKKASKQTYYTIRTLVDRDLVPYAYMAYGYFRWMDDVLDATTGSGVEKIAFASRQKTLLDACYQSEWSGDLLNEADLCPEELILVELVRRDPDQDSGLAAYLYNMMAVMQFDADRRGRAITQAELADYTQNLALAVTEALHYFIGHDSLSPRTGTRYHAVIAAHITHMLRDAVEDVEAGYFNIPVEYLQQRGISARDVDSLAYRSWVCSQVNTARRYFQAGRAYLTQVQNLRCRLAGYAYTARFEWMLRTIERDNYCLRCEYPQRKSLGASLYMAWTTMVSLFFSPNTGAESGELAANPIRISEL